MTRTGTARPAATSVERAIGCQNWRRRRPMSVPDLVSCRSVMPTRFSATIRASFLVNPASLLESNVAFLDKCFPLLGFQNQLLARFLRGAAEDDLPHCLKTGHHLGCGEGLLE